MNGILFEQDAPCYASSKFPEPRPFQSTAHEKLRQGRAAGHKNQMVMAPTGAGKSYLGLRIAHEALLKGKRVIFVCDRTTLINQTSEAADGYGLSAHGIIQAAHWRFNPEMPFQIASAQTLARRDWPDADVIIIDECFPAGTLIDTPNGAVPIESLSSGKDIYNCCGKSHILSVFSKKSQAIVKIGLSNGQRIECTADHPIFTELGWKPASALGIGTRLFRREDVQALWKKNDADKSEIEKSDNLRSGMSVQRAGMLRVILRK